MNAEDFVLLAKQKQKEQQQRQQRQQQQQQQAKGVFGSQATHKPAFGKSPTPPPPPAAAVASNPPPASTGQKKANVWTRPVASPSAPAGGARGASPNGVPSPASAAPAAPAAPATAAVVPSPPASNGNTTSNKNNNNNNSNKSTGATANIKSTVATQTNASMITKKQQQQQQRTVVSNVSKGTPSPVAKQQIQQPQQQQKEKAKSPLVEVAKFPKDPQPMGTATTKDAPTSAGPVNTTTTTTSVTNKSVPTKLSSGAAAGGSRSNATNATTTTTATTNTNTTKVIPTQPLSRRRASPPADAIYTENESLLTDSPGPPEVQNNNNNAKKSSITATTKAAAAVSVKESAAAPPVAVPAVVPLAGPAKEYRGKISCPACAKDFEGSSKLRVHVIKCRGAHAGGSKMALLTDDRINAYVAAKHREALQLGKDAAQQRKKDAASAEMTPSKAMTEATDDDSDSEEPKIFHPSKKQLNEKGKDSGDEKNNATLGKEKSTLQGIEETLLGDGDSDSDDRDFATHAADVASRKKKTPSKQRAGASVRVTPDDALAERLLRDDVNFPPAATNSTRSRGGGAKNTNKLDDFESDDEQRPAFQTQKFANKSNDKVPEALRCTRTNGVWRCSKEKVAGAIFCEKHLPKSANVKLIVAKGKSGRGKQTVDDIEPEKEDLLTDDEEEEEDETAVPNKKDTSFRGRKPHLLVSGDAVKKPVSLTGKTLDCPHCGKRFEKNSPGRSSHIRACVTKTRNAGGKIRNSVSLTPSPVKSVSVVKKVAAAPAPAPVAPPPPPAKAAASSALTCEKCGKVCKSQGPLTMHVRSCKGNGSSIAAPPVAPAMKKRGRPPSNVPVTAMVPEKLPKPTPPPPEAPTIQYKSNDGKPDWMCRARGGNWCCNRAKLPGDTHMFCEKHTKKKGVAKRPAEVVPGTEPPAAKKAKTTVRIGSTTRFCGYCTHEKFQNREDMVAHLKTRHGITEVVVSNSPVDGVTTMPRYDPDAAPGILSPSPSPLTLPDSRPPARIAAAKSAPVLFQQAPAMAAAPAETDLTCQKCGKVLRNKAGFVGHVRVCKGANAAFNANTPAIPPAAKLQEAVGTVGTRRQRRNEPPSSDFGVASPSVPRKDVAVVSTKRNERSSSLALTVPNNKSSGGIVTAVADSAEIAKLLEVVNTQNARIQQQDIAIKKLADQCLLMSQNIKTGWLPPFDPTAEIKRIKAPGANPGYNPIIQFGRLLWLTGIVSRELSNDAGEQTLSALQNMKFMLTQAGTDLKHLLRVTLHVSDIRVMEKTASAWKEFFIKRNGMKEEDLPVRLTTQAVLKDPKFLVEVHAEAVVPEKKDDMKSAADGAKAALGSA
jgi:enamine deaminase RidA (YjgF/YER057c/UK114 family)